MSDDRTYLVDEQVLAFFGTHTARVAAALHDQIARNRATAQALRDYLQARDAGAGPACAGTTTALSSEGVRDARAYARRRCAELHVSEHRRDVLELAVSELLGNALRHGRPPVGYDITPDGDDLLLVVGDGNPRPPGDGTDCGPDCENGRGLFLISELARSWGWESTADGKRVWVRV